MSKKLIVGCCFAAAACGTFDLLRPGAGQTLGGFPAPPVSTAAPVTVTTQPGQNFGYAVFSPDNSNAPREVQLNLKITEIIQKYTAAKDDDAKRASRDQLSAALGELFDLRQKQREDEIKQIEDRVAKLRETLKKRESKRQELIEHHLTTIIQDAEGLGWGSDAAGANAFYARQPGAPAFGGNRFDVRTVTPLPSPVPVLPALPSTQPRGESRPVEPKKNEPQM